MGLRPLALRRRRGGPCGRAGEAAARGRIHAAARKVSRSSRGHWKARTSIAAWRSHPLPGKPRIAGLFLGAFCGVLNLFAGFFDLLSGFVDGLVDLLSGALHRAFLFLASA
jgi:hypothetical protein